MYPLITVLNLVKRFPGIVQDGETDVGRAVLRLPVGTSG